jgi:hypothetical protein
MAAYGTIAFLGLAAMGLGYPSSFSLDFPLNLFAGQLNSGDARQSRSLAAVIVPYSLGGIYHWAFADSSAALPNKLKSTFGIVLSVIPSMPCLMQTPLK